jgi:hypothetical protein
MYARLIGRHSLSVFASSFLGSLKLSGPWSGRIQHKGTVQVSSSTYIEPVRWSETGLKLAGFVREKYCSDGLINSIC